MISLSTHVLDTTCGKPVADLHISLSQLEGDELLLSATTDSDGRISAEHFGPLAPGSYKLRFHTRQYLHAHYGSAFYPLVDVAFTLEQDDGHYHVPLLLSPYGFSSYRGS